jgi:FkbM family methyltransferase
MNMNSAGGLSGARALFSSGARTLRRIPLLNKADFLWRVLRPFYYKTLNWNGEGVPVRLSGGWEIRIPPEFLTLVDWAQYEEDSMDRFCRFVADHPELLVLDIGCFIGVFTVASLFANPRVEVVAMDPSLANLKALQCVCQYAKNRSFKQVWGFAVDRGDCENSLKEIDERSMDAITKACARGDVGEMGYKCLTDEDKDAGTPSYTVDCLCSGVPVGKACLMKCDVEGAEMLVLRGAEKMMEKLRPTLLLSVHPLLIQQYGFKKEDVRIFLESKNYQIQPVDTYYNGHEESWWCTPAEKAV